MLLCAKPTGGGDRPAGSSSRGAQRRAEEMRRPGAVSGRSGNGKHQRVGGDPADGRRPGLYPPGGADILGAPRGRAAPGRRPRGG